MQKITYRIHFKSGLYIDVIEETEKETYLEVFKELLNTINGTRKGTNTYECRNGKNGEDIYMFLVNDIVCIEKTFE